MQFPTKAEARERIAKLVERFEEQLASYKKNDYNETLTRRDFVDPFFKALGWDVDNEQGFAEAYREVIHEDRVKVGGANKAPDYSFRLAGGKRLFFVEAKKPSVDVKESIEPAYQVRRYGYSAKLAISILTDFEEFAVYDCTKQPKPTDKAAVARIKYIHFKDYLNEFDFIWDTFSKEKVLKGSFDQFVKSDKNKKGTATVDKDFLTSLDGWRELLAENLAKDKTLDEDGLNYAVQQTIDRLIFLRNAEDRAVEPYGNLQTAVSGKSGEYYQNLYRLFLDADKKYNSGLFNFQKDTLSANLKIDNKTLKTIVNQLYYPDCPFEFSVMPVEILGSAYEQFLGKQITLDKRHKIVIEQKPEVRKAGGVFYTPQYIVDYIVENTIGKLLDGKTPEDAAKLKIVDPACGSGSFLLGAYQYLLNWHTEFYRNNPTYRLPETTPPVAAKGRKTTIKTTGSPLTPEGRLTSTEKKRILLNNLYGVDLDVNAVEVTKLSLLLKCMEGETPASIAHQLGMFNERVLPTLDDNIKSGNSLIDVDFYDGQLDFDPAAEKKIKPFSWKNAFPEPFKQGGFDVVIGNPPYVRQELLLPEMKTYFEKGYKVYHGMADLYSFFFEKSAELLKPDGLFSVIVANKWMRANYGEALRQWLKQRTILEIIDFGDLPVFEQATAYPCVITIRNTVGSAKTPFAAPIQAVNVQTLDFVSLAEYADANRFNIETARLSADGWQLSDPRVLDLLDKLKAAGEPLGEYVKGQIYRGVLTGLNEAFVIDAATRERLINEDPRSAEIIKPFLAGRDVKRYAALKAEKYLIFTRRGIDLKQYPAIENYLLQFKTRLMPKPKGFTGEWAGRKEGKYQWFEIQDAVDYFGEFEKRKIIIPSIIQKGSYTFDEKGFYSNDKTSILLAENPKYILGLLNSKLLDFFIHQIASTKQGGYFEYKPMYVSRLPIIQPNPKINDAIITLVDQLLQLNEDLPAAKIATQKDQIQSKIDYCENKLDALVYELYGLTADEIKIVEGK